MPITAIIFGILLILTGVVGYVYGVMSEKASLTAFIPAAFGLVIAILGLAAQSKESLRKHLMHGAVVVGLIGFLVPAGRLVMKFSELNAAAVSQIVMALLCLIFVLICVRSFIAARRNAAG